MCYILTGILKLKNEKARNNTASKWHKFTTVLGITMLAFLVPINIAGATQHADVFIKSMSYSLKLTKNNI